MLILAIDTSGRVASCSLWEDGAERASCVRDSNLDHSRTILPLCREMLEKEGLTFRDVDAYAAAVGPGSFTGIRIGVAAVKGFALAGDKPAAGVSTLEAAAALVEGDGLIASVIRAREDEYYYAFFRRENGELYRFCDDGVLLGRELRALLMGAQWRLCGDGAADFLEKHPSDNAVLTDVVQSAKGVAACAWELSRYDGLVSGGDVVPVYLKKTQAERMREEKNK